MSKIMMPVINNNGSNRESMVEDRRNLLDALDNAMKALQALKPHGRDYQTLSLAEQQHRMEMDNTIYKNRFAVLDEMRNTVMDEALAIQEGN